MAAAHVSAVEVKGRTGLGVTATITVERGPRGWSSSPGPDSTDLPEDLRKALTAWLDGQSD